MEGRELLYMGILSVPYVLMKLFPGKSYHQVYLHQIDQASSAIQLIHVFV